MPQVGDNGLNSFHNMNEHCQIRGNELGPSWPVLIGGIEDVSYFR